MKKNDWFGRLSSEHAKLIRTMKLTLLLLTLGIGAANATQSYSQETYFTFDTRNQTIKELFREIESSSEFIFFYLDESLDVDRRVSVSVNRETVDSVLDQVFRGTENRYEISDRQIIITKAEAPASAPAPVPVEAPQQQRGVSGTVSDSSGPVVGAYVLIRGTQMGTVTDTQGGYSIQNVPDGAVLVFSYLGYETQEVPVGNQTRINVTLEQDTQAIGDVVVVGYGSMQKKDLTGSVSQVQSEDLQDLAVTRVDQALSGKLAGVQVLSVSGEPGAAPQIRVRGVGSISAGTQPLYVIDGFPGDNLAMINPNDIASIDVLKDASATAIYGSRGANGVVIITTKRG